MAVEWPIGDGDLVRHAFELRHPAGCGCTPLPCVEPFGMSSPTNVAAARSRSAESFADGEIDEHARTMAETAYEFANRLDATGRRKAGADGPRRCRGTQVMSVSVLRMCRAPCDGSWQWQRRIP